MNGQSSRTSPFGSRVAVSCEAHEAHRQPAGEIEEVELLDVPGEASQLGRHSGEEGDPQPAILVEQLLERRPAEAQRLDRLDGGGRRGMRRTVEQRQLAEEVAGLEGGDDRLVPLGRWQHDLHGAGGHDVQRVAGIALVKDHLVAPEASPHHGASSRSRSPGASTCAKSAQRRRLLAANSSSGTSTPIGAVTQMSTMQWVTATW